MTALLITPHEEFERWYADMRMPAPRTSDLVSSKFASMADYFPTSADFNDKAAMSKAFFDLASNYDIDGLRRASESPAAAQAISMAKEGRWPQICYCVAHMLVDGGGQEEFAKEWMASHWPAIKGANQVIDEVLSTTERSKVQNQQLLGISYSYDFFTHNSYGNSALHRLADKDQTAAQCDEACNVLAAALRMHHPKQPPKVAYLDGGDWHENKNLIDTFWRGPTRFHNLLPALDRAYGRGNPEVEAQVHLTLDKLIANGGVSSLQTTENDTRWAEISKWGDAQTARAIMQSHVKLDQHMPFVSVLGGTGAETAIKRCQQLLSMGFDGLDDLVEMKNDVSYEVPEDGRVQYTLLHHAILQQNDELVGWLLGQNCDPTKRSVNTVKPEKELDGIQMADGLSLSSSAIGMPDMLRAAAASRAARAALEEMGLTKYEVPKP